MREAETPIPTVVNPPPQEPPRRTLTPEQKEKMKQGRADARERAKTDKQYIRDLEKAMREAREQMESPPPFSSPTSESPEIIELRTRLFDMEARLKMAEANHSFADSQIEDPAGVSAVPAPLSNRVGAPVSPTPSDDACRCGHSLRDHYLDLARHPTELVCHAIVARNARGETQICACGHYLRTEPPPPDRIVTIGGKIYKNGALVEAIQGMERVVEHSLVGGEEWPLGSRPYSLDEARSRYLDTLDILEAVLMHTRLKATVGYVQGRCIACVETHRTGSEQACIRGWQWLEAERRRMGV